MVQRVTGRGSYHHGNLREALLEAALEATRADGVDGLALRDLARRVGVSPNAAYRHFADRDALLGEVARRLQGDVAARMDAELDAERGAAGSAPRGEPGRTPARAGRSPGEPGRSPGESGRTPARAALRAVGLGYIAYALEEPGWFEVAFADTPQDPWRLVSAPGPAELPPPLARLVAALDGLVASGELTPERRAGAEWPCWSAVHGFALLVLAGPLRAMPVTEQRRVAEQTVDAIVAGVLA